MAKDWGGLPHLDLGSETLSTTFLQQLIRGLVAEPRVHAAYVGGDLMGPSAATAEQVAFHLAVEPSFHQGLSQWLEPLGELLHSGPDTHGWSLVTPDGMEWRLYLVGVEATIQDTGLQLIFDRRSHQERGHSTTVNLVHLAGSFWLDLYRVAKALEKGRSLTAHQWLTACGQHLINLYRLALAPTAPGEGWEGADGKPEMVTALEPLREVLVAPLESRLQWRSAQRLAIAYEGLMLPLCERLGAAYPMAMRNLAFQRLDQARPAGQKREWEADLRAALPSEEPKQSPAPSGPSRLRLTQGRLRRG